MKREFLMAANRYNPDRHELAGMYVSEKLDGSRVFWDGGLSRGIALSAVPWANTINPKTGQPKPNLPERATGLWSRYGNPVIAPDWWLNQLPVCPLDGELWAGRGNFQTLRSIVSKNIPDDRWEDVQFAVFGSPSLGVMFQAGEINNANFVLTLDEKKVEAFIMSRLRSDIGKHFTSLAGFNSFDAELHFLSSAIPSEGSTVLYLHPQYKLPGSEALARTKADEYISRILDQGGEGLMIRDPKSVWTPKRVSKLLKWKPFNDDIGTLKGFTAGRLTEKGSRLLGKIGALILDFDGKRLELSGLTDVEREFLTEDMCKWATEHPGQDMPATARARHFEIGETVEFRFRELSDGGIPKEARLLRKC